MSAFDYGRLMSLLRLAGTRLLALPDNDEEDPDAEKCFPSMLRELDQAERDLKTCKKILLTERKSSRLTGGAR